MALIKGKTTRTSPNDGSANPELQSKDRWGTIVSVIYTLALLVALSLWLLPVRAPLWLDETVSYWGIAGGFTQIWARSVETASFPAYFYILWLTKAVFGAKEIVLRIPSILAMAAATYVFYRCARELFARDVAMIATLVFILDNRIWFAAIDVRPYPFAMLVTVVAILGYIRWSKTKKTSDAALLGVASAAVFYFHYLFGVCIVAAFVVAYFTDRWRSLSTERRQLGIAVSCFAVLMLPVWPRIWHLSETRSTHTFADAPSFAVFLQAIGREFVPFVFVSTLVVAVLMRKVSTPDRRRLRQFVMCAALALAPALILYIVSVTTPMHLFVNRYEAVVVSGIALAWAWSFSLIDSRLLRVLGCAALVTCFAYQRFSSPMARDHSYSWKYALQVADANAGVDGAPVVICSDFPEADFQDMPTGPPSESSLFAPLSYYKVQSTVVPLPRALNEQAQLIGRSFVSQAASNHQRFLAVCYQPSYLTLDWLVSMTSGTHVAHWLGDFHGVRVFEFDPRNAPGGN